MGGEGGIDSEQYGVFALMAMHTRALLPGRVQSCAGVLAPFEDYRQCAEDQLGMWKERGVLSRENV